MEKRALFVGVDEYEDGSIENLECAVEDAYGLAAAFETQLGFERVERLRNPRGKKDILRKVRELTEGLGKGDLFFFFFAGHGFRVKENHVLVCAEDLYADLEDEYDGLPVGQLKKQARGPWDRMLVIDACQSDIRKNRSVDVGMSARDLALILDDREEDGEDGGEGVQVVVTSCSERQKALEVGELRHGLFTSALLETVKEHAQERRRLDMAGFQTEMRERMRALAGKYRLTGKQNPEFRVPGECAIVLLEGTGEAIAETVAPKNTGPVPDAERGKVCELCGEYHPLTEMFRCRQCRKWYCKSHRDPKTFLCATCTAAKKHAEEEAAQKRRAEDDWRHKEEEAQAPAEAEEAAAPEAEEAVEEAFEELEDLDDEEEAAKWNQTGEDAYYEQNSARQDYAEASRKAAEQGGKEAKKRAEEKKRKAADLSSSVSRTGNGAVRDEFVRKYDNGGISGRINGGYIVEPGRSVYRGAPIRSGELGQGVWESDNGCRYEGGFRYGVEWGSTPGDYEGYGVLTEPDGTRYAGEWLFSKKHGRGRYTYPNGDCYDGDWVYDARSGHGVFLWKSGDRYEGEFKKGKRHGHGIYTWKNGDVFEGEWKNNRRQGRGRLRFANGTVQEGVWKDDQYAGRG